MAISVMLITGSAIPAIMAGNASFRISFVEMLMAGFTLQT
jgi:hypothetical protein